jgi:hypothetical protein
MRYGNLARHGPSQKTHTKVAPPVAEVFFTGWNRLRLKGVRIARQFQIPRRGRASCHFQTHRRVHAREDGADGEHRHVLLVAHIAEHAPLAREEIEQAQTALAGNSDLVTASTHSHESRRTTVPWRRTREGHFFYFRKYLDYCGYTSRYLKYIPSDL